MGKISETIGICQQSISLLIVPHEVRDVHGANALNVSQGEVKFVNVSFAHAIASTAGPIEQRLIFRNQTLTIPPGQKVGLVGYSGSGKSTFVNLIVRLFDLQVFEVNPGEVKGSENNYVFISIGGEVPKNAQEVSIVKPAIFTEMLAKGFFPIGSIFRAHTNQSSAEHDLAHLAGFISEPAYMKTICEAFRRIYSKIMSNSRTHLALENMNSLYSIRIYYMIEVFTIIPGNRKSRLQELVELPLDEPLNFQRIVDFLEEKAKQPILLSKYLYRLYNAFPALVNPVGGESRDILNRSRKFSRGSRLGTFYSARSDNLESKFDGSSIYSLFQNGLAALENKRSTHSDFIASLKEIHAPLIGALIGTSQLEIEDWVLQSVEEVPDPQSKLYQYLCGSGMWNRAHMIYWAYGEEDYSKILHESDMHE